MYNILYLNFFIQITVVLFNIYFIECIPNKCPKWPNFSYHNHLSMHITNKIEKIQYFGSKY